MANENANVKMCVNCPEPDDGLDSDDCFICMTRFLESKKVDQNG